MNNGDLAMLQATVARLRVFCPEYRVRVFVQRADLLRKHCPEAEPLDLALDFGKYGRLVPETLVARLPSAAGAKVRVWEGTWRTRSLRTFAPMAGLKARLLGAGIERSVETAELLAETAAVVSTGGGFITDSFLPLARRVLSDMRIASEAGIPIALFGQGLGPLRDAYVLEAARRVFPRLVLVSLREGRQGPSLAREWMGSEGVERILVTGDDAIEGAYHIAPHTLGAELGVNLRVSVYSQVSEESLRRVSRAVNAAAAELDAPLKPVVISWYPEESDVETIRRITGDHPLLGDPTNYGAPEKAAAAISGCRTVVTGSYHAGVFALSQGIPVIGLTRSAYYDDKFLGLAHQFGGGVQVVHLDAADLETALVESTRRAWEAAPDLRPRLLDAAKRQIECSIEAYRRFAAVLYR
jgi:polysaccharide pyruvyl transferase WcaK-like protein